MTTTTRSPDAMLPAMLLYTQKIREHEQKCGKNACFSMLPGREHGRTFPGASMLPGGEHEQNTENAGISSMLPAFGWVQEHAREHEAQRVTVAQPQARRTDDGYEW